MPDSSITPAQEAFVATLKQKFQQQLSSQLDGTFEMMSVPNGFFWGIQFGPNNYYNQNALDQINLQAIKGSNGMLTIGNASFTTLYNGIIGDVVFGFSESDQKAMDKDNQNNATQMNAVVDAWEDTVGEITTEETSQKDIFPNTKLGYIEAQVASRWDNDVDKIPDSMQEFKAAYQSYKVSAAISQRLYSQSAAAMTRLGAARTNSLNATQANGGMQTGAASYYQRFGPLPAQNKINGSLQTTDNSVSIQFDLNNFSSTSSQLSINGQAGISIPILDFMSIDLGGSTHYSLDKYASSQTHIKMTMTYDGITVISTPLTKGLLATNNQTGWYAPDVLSQAIANTDQSRTGFCLTGSQYPVDVYFGPGKKFSRIKTWVLSQQPSIEMTFCNADTSSVVSDFKEDASLSVKLFGIFGVGSVKQSYAVQSVDDKSSAGCVTLKLGPPKVIGTTPSSDATAYVVGGVPSYPPDNT